MCDANLFGFRATDPADLKAASDPIGPRNDLWLRRVARRADRIVAVWGNDGAFRGRSAQIRSMFQPRLFVIRMNGSGEPAHPLYLPKRLTPIAWPGVDVRQSRDG